MGTRLVESSQLEQLVTSAFVNAGAAHEHAICVAKNMVEADLRGVASHGSRQVGPYINLSGKGFINLKPNITAVVDSGPCGSINGDMGFGQVVALKAINSAIEKSKKFGIGCVVGRDMFHTGFAGYYAMQAGRANLIGIYMNDGPRAVPAYGGVDPMFGTNPLAICIPSRDGFPIALDMAPTITSMQNIFRAAEEGSAIPSDWAKNKVGEATTDPREVLDGGFLNWIGGHKGYGLAFMVQALCGLLSEGKIGLGMSELMPLGKNPLYFNCLCIVIDPARFTDTEKFFDRAATFVQEIKSSKRAKGVKEIILPGERGFALRTERLRTGIPLQEDAYQQLLKLAKV